MPNFRDNTGREWSLRFDGLTLRALREDLKIDLADVTGATYAKLESDDAELTAAVCFLLRNQLATAGLKKEQFAENLTGESLEGAMQALWGAAKVFFRPNLWSALESNCAQRRERKATSEQMAAGLATLNHPEVPPEIRTEFVGRILDALMPSMTAGNSPLSPESLSALGLAEIPANSATDSPDSARSTPPA